jgi:protein involved in polysaccharide export with SLBB domain
VVYGAVRSPSRLNLRPALRLAEAITIAGGLTERAATTIQVIHSGLDCFVDTAKERRNPGPVLENLYSVENLAREDESSNPYLLPGDIVIVAELAPIYVTGFVAHPQAIYPKDMLTLTGALALAGGILPDSTNTIRIYRQPQGSSTRTTIKVDLKKAKRLSTNDLILQPYDIIEVVGKGNYSARKMAGDWF